MGLSHASRGKECCLWMGQGLVLDVLTLGVNP